MKNKKGFMLIEFIITIVVVISTLVLLYSSYSTSMIDEKNRLYFDDITYIYKTYAIKNTLESSIDNSTNIHELASNILSSSSGTTDYRNYALFISPDFTESITSLDYYNLSLELNSTGIYVPKENIEKIKTCIKGKDTSAECTNFKTTIKLYNNLEYYFKTIRTKNLNNISDYGIFISYITEDKTGKYINPNTDYEYCMRQKAKNANPGMSEDDAYDKFLKEGNYSDNDCIVRNYISWVYFPY